MSEERKAGKSSIIPFGSSDFLHLRKTQPAGCSPYLTVPTILQKDKQLSSSHAQKALCRGQAECIIERIYFVVHSVFQLFENQYSANLAAHLTCFKRCQMCSALCNYLIYMGYFSTAHPEVNSFKTGSSILPVTCPKSGDFLDFLKCTLVVHRNTPGAQET